MGGNSVRCVILGGLGFIGVSSGAMAQSVATGIRPEAPRLSPVTIEVANVPLAEVIELIARQASLRPYWDEKKFNGSIRVTLHVRGVPADEAFAKILWGTGFVAVIEEGRVTLARSPVPELHISGSISGHIVDAKTQKGVHGAVITLDDNPKGVASDEDGRFRVLMVSSGEHTVRVRVLGYVKTTKATTVANGQTTAIEIMVEPSVNALDQVVVTGAVIPTELRSIPNAMTVITTKDIERRGITRIDQLFHGDVPGLYAQDRGETSSQYPGQVTMASRGATSLSSAISQPIKTYVDGVELADASYLGLIDPKSIERIEILTGPQASTIYGSNAINGVMQVFTKRGTTTRPQVLATIQGGWIQNNLTTALAPQHDDMLQISGIEGHISYNVGGSWGYIGAWTPAVHFGTLSGFGGVRFSQGPITADASLRRSLGANWYTNTTSGRATAMSNGTYTFSPVFGVAFKERYNNTGQTLSGALTYRPVSWWSQTLTLGTDVLQGDYRQGHPKQTTPDDTIINISANVTSKLTLAYSTTTQVPLSNDIRVVATAGIDGWNSRANNEMYQGASSTTGATYQYISMRGNHNRGVFVQGQLGLWDMIFLTYGLRAEWSPTFGPNVSPNFAPRYGVAVARDIGPVTAKLRGSYGRSTRPPVAGQIAEMTNNDLESCCSYLSLFGRGVYQRGNRDLLPEQQQGGEGGVELYLGNRASVTVTRYNQTVSNLISYVTVDSLDFLPAVRTAMGCLPWGCQGYETVGEYLNVGNIRNQGWEMQGSFALGPFTTKGTYAWNKSRIIGITERWRSYTSPTYATGAPFQLVPEHTWALEEIFGMSGTSVSFNIRGQGVLFPGVATRPNGELNLINLARLMIEKPRMNLPAGFVGMVQKFAIADVNVSRRISTNLEGLLQVRNATNSKSGEFGPNYGVMGRQTKIGIRVRM